jgi:hypothetical protein
MLRRKRILVSNRLWKLIDLVRQLDTQYTLSLFFGGGSLYSTLSILSKGDIHSSLKRVAGQGIDPDKTYIEAYLRRLKSYCSVASDTVECYTGDLLVINQFIHRGETRVSIFRFCRDGGGERLNRIKRRALVNSVFYGAPFDTSHYIAGDRLRRVVWQGNEAILTPSTLLSLPKPILLCSEIPEAKALLERASPAWCLIESILGPLLDKYLEYPRSESMVRDLVQYLYSTTRSAYVNTLATLLDKTRVIGDGDVKLLIFIGLSIYSTALKLLPDRLLEDYGTLVVERCRYPIPLPRWTLISWNGSKVSVSIPLS